MDRPGIWGIICQDATGSLNLSDEVPPIYDGASPLVRRRSRSMEMGAHFRRGLNLPLNCGPPPEPSSPASPPAASILSRSRSFLQLDVQEAVTYTYNLYVGITHVQVNILIESDQESDRPNHYTFSLSMKIGPVERAVSNPVTMKLSVDPRRLDFVVFLFPPRSSLPTGCLYHLRVWLRTSAGIDHRIFGEQDLWFGKDPDFGAIADASFASLLNISQDTSIYQIIVGRAHVNFTIRWTPIETGIYALALDYEAGGVGKTLFENYHLRLYCEVQSVTFLIYSIPVSSNPPGASHRLRVWIRTPALIPPTTSSSHLYQRLWKSDEFKVGAHLHFESVGHKIILGTRQRDVLEGISEDTTYPAPLKPLTPNRRRISRLAPNVGVDDGGETVNDR